MKPTLEQIKTDESVWPEGAIFYIPESEISYAFFIKKSGSGLASRLANIPDNWHSYGDSIPSSAIQRPAKAFVPEVECKTIYWVAEVDDHGTPWNFDGPHDTHEGAKDSIPFLLAINGKNRNLIVTSMQFRPIKSEREKFIEAGIEINKSLGMGATEKSMFEALYDSGKFKLVEATK